MGGDAAEGRGGTLVHTSGRVGLGCVFEGVQGSGEDAGQDSKRW